MIQVFPRGPPYLGEGNSIRIKKGRGGGEKLANILPSQVSPYNLWIVRIVRWVTVVFTALTFVWWVLQLVSIFITPPSFHTRGSGFFSFSYASLALIILIVTLLFFAAPSKTSRVLSAVMAVLLLTNMIIILAVAEIRREEAWVGIASVICMFVACFFGCPAPFSSVRS